MFSFLLLYVSLPAWFGIEAFWLNSEIKTYLKRRDLKEYEKGKYLRDTILSGVGECLIILGLTLDFTLNTAVSNVPNFSEIILFLIASLSPVVLFRYLQERLDKKN